MLNNINLIGRTTKEIELKYTNGGTATSLFSLAVERAYKDKNTGERQTDFINCRLWGKAAETFATYVKKGNLVQVGGRLETYTITDNQGNKNYGYNIVINDFSFLPQGSNSGSNHNSPNNYDTGTSYGNEVEIRDEDLPF